MCFILLLSALHAQTCDASLWKHVYHPQRLEVLSKCIAVSGTITYLRVEPDGDIHMRLKPDPQFVHLLNDRNRTAQHGGLVLEPVCVRPVKQADAIAACRGLLSRSQGIIIPKRGQHVVAVGSYVQDNEANHLWREIHPVTSIEVK